MSIRGTSNHLSCKLIFLRCNSILLSIQAANWITKNRNLLQNISTGLSRSTRYSYFAIRLLLESGNLFRSLVRGGFGANGSYDLSRGSPFSLVEPIDCQSSVAMWVAVQTFFSKPIFPGAALIFCYILLYSAIFRHILLYSGLSSIFFSVQSGSFQICDVTKGQSGEHRTHRGPSYRCIWCSGWNHRGSFQVRSSYFQIKCVERSELQGYLLVFFFPWLNRSFGPEIITVLAYFMFRLIINAYHIFVQISSGGVKLINWTLRFGWEMSRFIDMILTLLQDTWTICNSLIWTVFFIFRIVLIIDACHSVGIEVICFVFCIIGSVCLSRSMTRWTGAFVFRINLFTKVKVHRRNNW